MHISWICKRSCNKCLQDVEVRDQHSIYYTKHCGNYMGITKAKTYGVTEYKKQDNDVAVLLTHEKEDNESSPKQETANKQPKN
jgi:hypothetical protein